MKPFKTISSRIAWSCPWYSIRQDEIITPDGQPGVYNVVQKAPAVWVIPLTPAGEVVLIHTYRHTVDDWCWELPAGSQKPAQTLLAAAQAELREEVGGTSDDWAYLGWFYSANGICNEKGHVFLARDVVLGAPAHEAAEVMAVHRLPLEAALALAGGEGMTDGPSALALLRYGGRLRGT